MAGLRIKQRALGFLGVGGGDRFKDRVNKASLKAFKKSMDDTLKVLKPFAKNLNSSKFPGSKKTFENTWKVKRYNNDKKRFETALIYNKVPWFSIHETGGIINGKMVVPLYTHRTTASGRIGMKKWKALLKQLKSNNQSFFKKVNGNILLFAISNKSNNSKIRSFSKGYRTHKGIKRIKGGTAVPIGIVLNKIRIKRRFDFSNKIKEKGEVLLARNYENNLDLTNI